MGERERHVLARTAAETMYNLWELEGHQRGFDLDRMMRRLKDLSAYSLTHAEIMDQREVVELLALTMFFGATSDSAYHPNQDRLQLLSEEMVAYEGRAEAIEQEVVARKRGKSSKREKSDDEPLQPRLL